MTTTPASPQTEHAPELSVIVPVYQEERTIGPFLARLCPVLDKVTPDYEIIFSMDPGRDNTQGVIESFIAQNPRIRLLVMTRRWGQPAATMAGIEHARGRASVVIDVDLQDPPELIADLVAKWKEGFEVVYAQRKSRKGETLPKRLISYAGYWVINRISDVPIPRNTGDFRLLDRRVMDSLCELKETHGFLRGLVAFVGYRQTAVLYDRDARAGGQSKYSQITGSMRIGMNGVVAFSSKPLTLATFMGFSAAGLSLLASIVYVGRKLVLGESMAEGAAPILLLVTFLGGVQLISLGIMGEYVGRIYEEVRGRPQYLVSRKINFQAKPDGRS